MNERGNSLRVLGIGESFEEAVGRTEHGKSHFRPVDEGRESFVMAFSGFAEKHRLDAAAGTQRFFDKAGSFNTDESILGREPPAKSDAEFLEPTIIAAGEQRVITGSSSAASGFSGCCHHRGA